ncbi:MAG: hypothetical protein LBM69_00430 [Lachnospiraceae bacterium]|jgi:hypothetical protein|nr:hypothetical protein [Lachnospiraceae bacterium]
MSHEDQVFLNRINQYAEEVLGEIDPQKVPVSTQLKALRPIMEQISIEKGMTLEDLFILYMDLQSEAKCEAQKKLNNTLADL